MKPVPNCDLFIDDDLVLYRYNKKTGRMYQPTVFEDSDGYLRVSCVRFDCKMRHIGVHQAVAFAFIPNDKNKPTVDHWNRNKKDNRICNLRWADYREQEANKDRTEKARKMHDGTRCKNWVNGKHIPNDETRLHDRIHYQLNIDKMRAQDNARYKRDHDKRLAASNAHYSKNMETRRRVLFSDGSHHWIDKDKALELFKVPVLERVWTK